VERRRPMTMKETLSNPIPLRWGLLAILLFFIFTVVTQLQFNKINAESVYRARYDAYLTAVQDYNNAIDNRAACLRTLEHTKADKVIFESVADMLRRNINLIARLYENEGPIKIYQENSLQNLGDLEETIDSSFKPLAKEICPDIPDNAPHKPER
jgi:hypothetical protein